MASKILSWFFETWRLTLRYLGVGACFAASALLAVVLQRAGVNSFASMILALALGFAFSYFLYPIKAKTVLSPSRDVQLETTSVRVLVTLEEEPGLFRLATNVAAVMLSISFAGSLQGTPLGSPIDATFRESLIKAATRAPEMVAISAPEMVAIDANLH